MTKHIALHLILAIAIPAVALSQKPDVGRLTGCWQGTANFFKPELAEKIGPVDLTLEFKDARLISGKVGAATLGAAPVSTSRGTLQLNAKVTGRIGPAPELEKARFILMVTSLKDTLAIGELHLKSNSIFDPRVREARVSLSRSHDDCSGGRRR